MIKIAINGFGRIGRQALKVALEKNEVEVVAINDLSLPQILAHLFVYDSVYGIYPKKVSVEVNGEIIDIEGTEDVEGHFKDYGNTENYLIIDNKRIKIIHEPDPSKLPWKELNIDVVLECTGRFVKDGAAKAHIDAGSKKVVVSAPTKGGDINTFLIGVNTDKYLEEEIVSNGSCTTNCVGPVANIINEKFGILKAAMTTIHSVTAEQNLVDSVPPGLHPDLRRARAAINNIVPTTSGAAISTTEAIKEIKGKFDGMAVRVPTLCGSLTDFTFLVSKPVTLEEVNQAFIEASESKQYDGIVEVTREPIVSSDIIGNPSSAIVDLSLTKVIDGDLVKVMTWYDNEAGYSNRLVEMAVLVGR